MRKTSVLLPTLLFYLFFTFWLYKLGPLNSLGCPGTYCVDQAGIEPKKSACLCGIKGMRPCLAPTLLLKTSPQILKLGSLLELFDGECFILDFTAWLVSAIT